MFTDGKAGFQLSDVPVLREVVDGLLQATTRTYLSEHPEEGVVIALVTNDVMAKHQYTTVLNGEADEDEIVAKVASYKELNGKPVIYIFDVHEAGCSDG